jgi:hypothetical protein
MSNPWENPTGNKKDNASSQDSPENIKEKSEEKLTQKPLLEIQTGENEKKEEIYRVEKKKLVALFKSYLTGKERIAALKPAIESVSGFLENSDEILKRLTECEQIDNRPEFINNVFATIRPVIDLMIERPELFEFEEEKQSEEKGIQKRIELNELLSYSIEGNFIFIHAVPKSEVKEGLIKMNEGLNKLAEIINERKEIQTVEVASWIVTKHPNIIKRLGFELDGEISDDFRAKYFHNDNAVIHRAHMAREDFLKKYLRKKD